MPVSDTVAAAIASLAMKTPAVIINNRNTISDVKKRRSLNIITLSPVKKSNQQNFKIYYHFSIVCHI
jgi:hypothetical protein